MSDQTAQPDSTVPLRGGSPGGLGGTSPLASTVSRRGLLRAAGASAAVVGGGGLLEACSSSIKGASTSSSSSSSSTAGAGTQDILIGFIHPLTGALADFGTSDNWIVSTIQATPQYKNGFKIGGKTYKVNIKSYDTQSDPTRAGQLASQAILSDKVDLLLASSTPETVNPVATTAEKLGTPLICGNVPWQAWYANLGGNPTPGKSTFKPTWTTMYFLGVNDLCLSFIPMWNKIHAQLQHQQGRRLHVPERLGRQRLPRRVAAVRRAGRYTLVDPPAYTDGLTDYTSFISEFKSKDCQFFTNVQLPPDFNVFWKQAAQQGFKPKLATVAKVLLFPSDVAALGSLVNNVATDAWWTPNMPWKSSLDRADLRADSRRVHLGYRLAMGAVAQQLQPLRGRLRGADLGEQPARQERGRRGPVQGEHRRPRRPAQLDLEQEPCSGCRGHALRRRAVEAELEVRLVDGGRRQYADARGSAHRNARADEQMTG